MRAAQPVQKDGPRINEDIRSREVQLIDHKGKAIVSSGSKEKVEADVAKLHAAGLWATMEQPS